MRNRPPFPTVAIVEGKVYTVLRVGPEVAIVSGASRRGTKLFSQTRQTNLLQFLSGHLCQSLHQSLQWLHHL